jgi:hypothetical protein
LPGTLTQLDRGLEDGELVGPGREAALAAKVVQAREDADQSVAGGLVCDLFELITHVRHVLSAARRLETCGAQEQVVQTFNRLIASRTVGSERAEPLARSGVDRRDDRCGQCRHVT